MFRNGIRVLLLGVVTIVVSSVYAIDSSTGDFSNVENEWYAETFKVSVEDAERRQDIAREAGEIAAIVDSEEDEFAGMVIQHQPKLRIIYNVKRKRCSRWYRYGWVDHHHCKNNLKKKLKKELRHKPWRKFVRIKNVRYSLADLKKIREKANQLATDHVKDGFSISISTQSNRVEIEVLDKLAFKYELISHGLYLPRGVFVREIKEFPKSQVWGGGPLSDNTGFNICTVGFVVVDSRGQLGVSTANHCDPNTASAGVFWNGTALTRVNRIVSRDTAWHSIPASLTSQARNRIRIGTFNNQPAFRNITGVATASAGARVCMYGITSRLQCGVVVATNKTQSFTDSAGVTTFTAGLIEVTRNGSTQGGGISNRGDSGGPLFMNNNAVGAVVGGSNVDSYFAPVSNITAMGISILTQ